MFVCLLKHFSVFCATVQVVRSGLHFLSNYFQRSFLQVCGMEVGSWVGITSWTLSLLLILKWMNCSKVTLMYEWVCIGKCQPDLCTENFLFTGNTEKLLFKITLPWNIGKSRGIIFSFSFFSFPNLKDLIRTEWKSRKEQDIKYFLSFILLLGGSPDNSTKVPCLHGTMRKWWYVG